MVFCSQIFLFFFLPLSLLFFYFTPSKFRNVTLLLFSLLFYFSGETTYIWLIFASILFNYLWAIVIHQFDKNYYVLLFGVAINLLALVYYKYAGFFLELLPVNSEGFIAKVLPLGISFYTFHSISYLVDVYRGKAKPQYNLAIMGLYIVNFSQLVAGPIVRYHDVENQLIKRIYVWNRFRNGIKIFIYGLAKKMIVANTVGVFADATFNNSYGPYNSLYAWLGILCYTLQIYFDFSGYSDMAIGIGRMFGFEFKRNFKLPYAAKNIKTFWQKWHISLSSWFKDYLYIPLGGNKHGNFRTALNLFMVFILCGLWHGANYTFLVWGLFHGAFLVLERIFEKFIKFKIPAFISHGYVWLIVMISWVFFRAETISEAFDYLKTMFSFTINVESGPDLKSFINPYFIFIICIGILSSIGVFKKLITSVLKNNVLNVKTYRLLEAGTLIMLFYWCVLEITNSNFNPFIYYRF